MKIVGTSAVSLAGPSLECFHVQDVISAEFIHRLKSLLQRAYSLQEEFEGVLCMSEPSSHSNSQGKSQRVRKTMPIVRLNTDSSQWFSSLTDKMADILAREELDDACLRDSVSIASTDSFVSAAEVRRGIDHRVVNDRQILIISHKVTEPSGTYQKQKV